MTASAANRSDTPRDSRARLSPPGTFHPAAFERRKQARRGPGIGTSHEPRGVSSRPCSALLHPPGPGIRALKVTPSSQRCDAECP